MEMERYSQLLLLLLWILALIIDAGSVSREFMNHSIALVETFLFFFFLVLFFFFFVLLPRICSSFYPFAKRLKYYGDQCTKLKPLWNRTLKINVIISFYSQRNVAPFKATFGIKRQKRHRHFVQNLRHFA